ncbi:hypothetical protein AB0L22_07940 [Micromonospora haikouensis]|uniref:hypothetical protein n=1 Tax=Micromonospora haikouensis TaxID=686309 RepID=UPI003440D793
MASGGTDDVGGGWNTARGTDDVALSSEEITAARVTALRHVVARPPPVTRGDAVPVAADRTEQAAAGQAAVVLR